MRLFVEHYVLCSSNVIGGNVWYECFSLCMCVYACVVLSITGQAFPHTNQGETLSYHTICMTEHAHLPLPCTYIIICAWKNFSGVRIGFDKWYNVGFW